MFQIAFNESGNVHYLIARADCYAATGDNDLALTAFEWADEIESARPNEERYIESTIARLTPPPTAEPEAAVASAEPELRRPNGYIHLSSVYRMNDTFTPPVPMMDLNEPHAGGELGWIALRGPQENAPSLGLFVRAYGALETDGVNMDQDTLQGGVGLRLQPFDWLDLFVRGEWLFPIGRDAREGWMFSASHSWGVGGEWRGMDHPWIFADTHLNGSWLPSYEDHPEYVTGSAETRLGFALPLGERLALLPYGVASLRYHEEDGTPHDAIGEAGLGLGLRYWFAGDVPGTVDLLGEYRWFVVDDTSVPLSEDGTWMGRLVISR